MRLTTKLLACILVVIAALVVRADIMGIDFGSDSMKISLVKSGKPIQIG